MKSIVGAVFFLVSFSVFAKDCESEPNMDAIRMCLENQSSSETDVEYKKLVGLLKGKPEAREKIKKAQAAWVSFRDSTCDYAAETYFEKGYGYREDARTNCLVEFENNRKKMLKLYQREAMVVSHGR